MYIILKNKPKLHGNCTRKCPCRNNKGSGRLHDVFQIGESLKNSQYTQPSKNLITENQKMDSAVFSDGFLHIVSAETPVDVSKSDTNLCDHVLKHGKKP